VQLNGSGSFDDNTPTENLIFDWTFVTVPGATPTLANAGTSMPSFTASSAGTYVIELVVTDQDGQASAPDEVVISSDSNLPPTPDAGPDQLVVVGSTVELSGANSSDPENDTIIFEWLWADWPGFPAPPPPAARLDTVSPNFIAESEGEHQLTLRVSDFLGPSNEFDLVSVIAVSASDFAQLRIVEANDTIGGLPATSVTTQGNQNALGNFLSQAITAIQEGEIAEAVDKLSKAIARTDGCVLRGVPDGNGSGRDWITSCNDQAVLYDSLNAALQALLGQ
jgi:hypothetical protein